MPHTSSQTFLREFDKKGAQTSCLFLHNEKATGKMPVLHYKITSTGKLIDDALEAVERGNPRNGDLRIASSSSPRMAIGTSPIPEGTPQLVSEASDNNANFAWVQHMLHVLAPNGSMALLLANCSMSSNSSGEGDIRRALIEADLVETATRECTLLKSEGTPQLAREARDNMDALPGQLFTNTQIPACIWFLTKNKAKHSRPGATALRDRRGVPLRASNCSYAS